MLALSLGGGERNTLQGGLRGEFPRGAIRGNIVLSDAGAPMLGGAAALAASAPLAELSVPFLFARNLGWHILYDQIPEEAEANRRKVYDMLVAEKMPVQGFHYPFPSHAYIEKSGNGFREIAVLWNPTI